MKKFTAILFLLLIIGIPTYIYFSPMFEREAPKIEINHKEYWNLRDNLKVVINDESGIKFYKIVLISDGKARILRKESFSPSDIRKRVEVDIKLPQYSLSSDTIQIKVEAVDNSKWNYFAGNEAKFEKSFKIDTTSPNTEVITNNYAMKRGGSGIVIVKIEDKNLAEKYIKITERDNPENFVIFKLTPFYKDNYYISLLAWPYNYQTFTADLYAIDKAGNLSVAHIPIRWRKPKYPKVNIKISDTFIKVVATPLLTKLGIDIPDNPIDIFKKINEELRLINEKKLADVTNVVLDKKIDNFYIKPFRPLIGYAKKASYGEMRSYFYNDEKISSAIHKGLDIASLRHAKIYATNSGKVLFEGFNGIYGNTLVLYHKIGFVSTYSHCSGFSVPIGSNVQSGTLIAHTGKSGAVFGDHLHFGIFIQGIPVEPLEWMDSHWIKDNITNVIINAKRIINR